MFLDSDGLAKDECCTLSIGHRISDRVKLIATGTAIYTARIHHTALAAALRRYGKLDDENRSIRSVVFDSHVATSVDWFTSF